MPSGAERRLLYPAAAGVVLVADLVTKALAERVLDAHTVLPVVGDVVRFHLVHNTGAAFGFDLGVYSRWILLATAGLAVLLITKLARNTAPFDRFRLLSLGLLAGGATGNLFDRMRSAQGVVDFIDIGLATARFPTFNIADIGVTTGAIFLATSYWLADARARAEA